MTGVQTCALPILGSKKAADFPEPVWLVAKISCLDAIIGRAYFYIGVGC